MPTRPRHHGLLPKLAAFFLVCGVPALLLLDAARVLLEHRRIVGVLDSPQLRDEVRREAGAISEHRRARRLSGVGLSRDLERWQLTLLQPSRSPFGEAAFALLESGPQPFVVQLLDSHGAVLGTSRADSRSALAAALPAGTRVAVSAADHPHVTRLYRTALAGIDGDTETLLLSVSLPTPMQRLSRTLGYEWPVVLVGAAVFAIVAAVFLSAWVTRRLRRIAETADAWRHGQFDRRIDDDAGDEIGALAQQLDTMPDALAELVTHRSERASRSERERIARDLHDTIKQQAFALSMQLGALRAGLPEAQRNQPALTEARALAEELQRELAALLDDLHPRPQDAGDWASLLRTRVADWSRRSGIAAELSADNLHRIAPARHEPLLRVLDEALSNVSRHSGAHRVQLRFDHVGVAFSLIIADDGHGGIVEGVGRGIGHLRERAQSLPDGRFEWRSGDSGSHIELHWTETVT